MTGRVHGATKPKAESRACKPVDGARRADHAERIKQASALAREAVLMTRPPTHPGLTGPTRLPPGTMGDSKRVRLVGRRMLSESAWPGLVPRAATIWPFGTGRVLGDSLELQSFQHALLAEFADDSIVELVA
jgi:hypothetical protein